MEKHIATLNRLKKVTCTLFDKKPCVYIAETIRYFL